MCLAAFMAGTTYSSSFENSMEIMNGQGWMEEKHRKLLGKEPPRFGTKWREVVYQREPAASSYKTDFGSWGWRCLSIAYTRLWLQQHCLHVSPV